MIDHDVTVEQWEYFTSRLDAAKKNAQLTVEPWCDPRIQNLINAFCSIPGVVTVWSCSGHTEEEKSSELEYTAAYLTFITRGADVPRILDRISSWIMAEPFGVSPRLEIGRLARFGATAPEAYPVYTIRFSKKPRTEEGVLWLKNSFDRLAAHLSDLHPDF